MKVRWVLFAQLWACTALAIEPGQNFKVEITWPAFVQHLQQLEPLTLHYNVNGCDQFTAVAQVRDHQEGSSNAPWKRVPLESTADGHGGYTAQESVTKLLPTDYLACSATSAAPYSLELQLEVTCHGDGRAVTSNLVPLVYAATDDSFVNFSNVSSLHAVDANRLVVVGSNSVALVHLDRPSANPDGTYLQREQRQTVGLASILHPVAHRANHAFVADGCLYPNCTQMTVEDPQTQAQLTTSNGSVYLLDLGPWGGPTDKHPHILGLSRVPGRIVRMVPQEDDSLLILSVPSQEDAGSLEGIGALGGALGAGCIVSRLSGSEVRTEAVLPGVSLREYEESISDLFLTFGSEGQVDLRSLKAPREPQPLHLPGSGEVHMEWVAPDGTQWLVQRNSGLYLCDHHGGTVLLPTEGSGYLSIWGGKVAWQADSVAVANAAGFNEYSPQLAVFDRKDGHLRGSFTPAGLYPPRARVHPLSNNRYLVDDNHHMRVFGEDANLLGGTEMPEACGGALPVVELPNQRIAWSSLGSTPFKYHFLLDLKNFH